MRKFLNRAVDPDLMIHPLRFELDNDDLEDLFVRIENDDETVTRDEIEACQDYLHDIVSAQKQTHYGIALLQ